MSYARIARTALWLWLAAGLTLGLTGAFHADTRAAIEAVARMMMEAGR